jgi:hypothetical protein
MKVKAHEPLFPISGSFCAESRVNPMPKKRQISKIAFVFIA